VWINYVDRSQRDSIQDQLLSIAAEQCWFSQCCWKLITVWCYTFSTTCSIKR